MRQAGIKKKQGGIVESLKEAILSGSIPCKTEMTQNELAESLGVSRMPVREALIILEYQGLIERLPNNHIRVAQFTDEFFEEIFDLCADLEGKALDAGGVPCFQAASSLFISSDPEELLLHYRIGEGLSNSFLRKVFNTILEIYVDYAVKLDIYDKEQGIKRLKEALNAPDEQRKTALKEYFSVLNHAIINDRRRNGCWN